MLFLWFSIEPRTAARGDIADYRMPQIEMPGRIRSLDALPTAPPDQSHILPDYLPHCRWFRAKSRSIRAVRITDVLPLSENSATTYLTIINVDYRNAESETYVLPISLATGEAAATVVHNGPSG